jgi:hypothetical protein
MAIAPGQGDDRRVSSNAYVLLAALGGSAITAVATLLTARRSARAELSQRRLKAYADLLVAVGDVLGICRRTWDAARSRRWGLAPDFPVRHAWLQLIQYARRTETTMASGSLLIAEQCTDRQARTCPFRERQIEPVTGRVLLHATGSAGRPLCGCGREHLTPTGQRWQASCLPHFPRCRALARDCRVAC